MTKTYTTTSMDLATGKTITKIEIVDFDYCYDCMNPNHLCICGGE